MKLWKIKYNLIRIKNQIKRDLESISWTADELNEVCKYFVRLEHEHTEKQIQEIQDAISQLETLRWSYLVTEITYFYMHLGLISEYLLNQGVYLDDVTEINWRESKYLDANNAYWLILKKLRS